MMESPLRARVQKGKEGQQLYRPSFFRLSNPHDRAALNQLLTASPHIAAVDELLSQLKELVKLRHPTVEFEPAQLDLAVQRHIGAIPHEQYGVWVYYPWSSKLVHILDEQEYYTVRTTRNRYKITEEEQAALSRKKVGVIGLSVGRSVAVTMAMERGYGAVRLADFDTVDLSNFNRIQTKTDNLGLMKTVSAAREISEIDPYIDVRCFNDGITEENIDAFFLEGGKLDMVIDECDGLDVKIMCRQKAKHHRIPLVQEMSDRETVDIERFDLEPDRPIMHGYIDHLDIDLATVRRLTNEEKIPYLLPMIGTDDISTELKASMLEVGQSITTWPQLASSISIGGGLAADVCRRIFLDQLHLSGRFRTDLATLITDSPSDGQPKKSGAEKGELVKGEPLTEQQMTDSIDQLPSGHIEDQVDLEATVLHELMTAAALAPSGGNLQPWKWIYQNKNLYLFRDTERTSPLLDYDNVCSNIALGTTTENVVLKAHELKLDVAIEKFPIADNHPLTAILRFCNRPIGQKWASSRTMQTIWSSTSPSGTPIETLKPAFQ